MKCISPLSHQFCCSAGGAAGYQAVITSILPVVAIALEDEKPEVSQAYRADEPKCCVSITCFLCILSQRFNHSELFLRCGKLLALH